MKQAFSQYLSLRFSSATALATLMVLGVNSAGAQNVTFSGDNGVLGSGCTAVTNVPSNCVSQTRNSLEAINAPTWSFSTAPNTGVMIGANLSNSNTGSIANGSASITDGGTVQSAYVYVGFENNAIGSISISGAGSKWTSSSAGIVGHYGTGTLNILGGGQYNQVNPDNFWVGYGVTGKGVVTVSGVDTTTGTRSSLVSKNRIYIGSAGEGELNILDGGIASSEYTMWVGEGASSTGRVTVSGVNQTSGDRSTLKIVNNQFWVGDFGHGTLNVLDGGIVEVAVGLGIGADTTGVGFARIDGVDQASGNRSTIKAQDLYVGLVNQGTLDITNGGLSTTNYFIVGVGANSVGVVNVDGIHATSGDRSTVEAATQIRVGDNGKADLSVTDGALVKSAASVIAGTYATGEGIITVDGAGSDVTAATSATIGREGKGTLNLSQGGTFNAASLQLAAAPTSQGTINIGTGRSSGLLNVSTVRGGLGNATVSFNHLDDIIFSSLLTGNLNINQINSGKTTLSASNDYAGMTTVTGGILAANAANRFSAKSGYDIGSKGTLALNDYNQTLLNLKNSGIVEFGTQAGSTLTVTNDYVGAGGTFVLNTVLGDDDSVTDRLFVGRDTSGTSKLVVKNINGQGAPTIEGIKIIDVVGASEGTFALIGDYVNQQGKQAVVGGAYAYTLYKNGISEPDDGNWYLRSELVQVEPKPEYQAGAPVYEAYAQALLGLNGVSTLQQRVGNRIWAGNGNHVISEGADIIGTPYATPKEAGVAIEGNGVWGRIEGTYNHIESRFSTSATDYNQNVFKFQAGIDGLLNETENGKLIGGITAHYVHGKTTTSSIDYADGQISTDGYGFGGTLTWYDDDGFYADGQAQVTWYNSDLTTTASGAPMLADGNKGFGSTLSLETGKRIGVAPAWSMTPQAQLVYSKVDFDDFSDGFGSAVSLNKGESLQGRIGVTLDHQTSWHNTKGLMNRANVYGIANMYYEFMNGTRVDLSGVSLASEKDRLWGGLGLGGSYNWDNDKYSVYGEGLVNTSLNNLGDSYSLKGNVGFRIKW